MIVYTDSVEFAGQIIPEAAGWDEPMLDPTLRVLADRLYGMRRPRACAVPDRSEWAHLFLVEAASASQFDVLVELAGAGAALPDRTLCLAGSGTHFHGSRERPWLAPAGNIYLSVYVVPPSDLTHPDVAFTVLAAVSVVDAIDAIPALAGRAGIKWVNDVVIDDAKVCGVLAHTIRQGARIDGAVLGIGVNVETTPDVPSTPFVPRAQALREFTDRPSQCRRDAVLRALLAALDRNYRLLVTGEGDALIRRYRNRSVVLGRHAVICAEHSGEGGGGVGDRIAEGRVLALDDDLALRVEGVRRPVRKGRLILEGGPVPVRSGVHGTA
ncbi:MAG: biotin--[acetyl-CoA-carboxylase] ligase [Gemmatimonadales bacterium]|jgi:BirA family biotin operon repressor/biotin-[acetyl-CoA-carboxylase] ligase